MPPLRRLFFEGFDKPRLLKGGSPRLKQEKPMTPCDSLADVRSAIDQIDQMLVGLLAERGRYVREAARFKPQLADVPAPARAEQVIDQALRHAQELGAAPQVVEAVYRSMVAQFIELECQHHASRVS
jgi:isochorismate pyruvate lyase